MAIGVTPPNQALVNRGFPGGVGRQSPASVAGGTITAAPRPSLARSAMMRSAARTPHAMPLSWAPPSGTRARDSASLAFRVAAWAGK